MKKANELLRQEVEKRPRGTQAALARDVGVQPQTITKWLRGQTGIPSEHWGSIERSLDLEPMAIARAVGGENLVAALAPRDVDAIIGHQSQQPTPTIGTGRGELEAQILETVVEMSEAQRKVLASIDSRLTGIERLLRRAVPAPRAPRGKPRAG